MSVSRFREGSKEHDKQVAKYLKADRYHWHRRFIKEMKGNKAVQDKVVKGKLDYALKPEKEVIAKNA